MYLEIPPDATHWLELSRAHLLHNLAAIRALTAPSRVMAVLKTNAYGGGAAAMAPILAQAGVDAFAVATPAEAVELRAAGIGAQIFCLSYLGRNDACFITEYNLTPVIFLHEMATRLSGDAQRLGRVLNVWVKVDTGLGRLGVPFGDAADFVARLRAQPGLRVQGLLTTLTENPERDPEQLRRLRAVHRLVGDGAGLQLSAASSNGILSLPASYLDMVRPGIALLGLEPSEPARMDLELVRRAGLQPVVSWKARAVYVKTLAADEQVGYGPRPALGRTTHVATLAVGWASGYPAHMSDGGQVLVAGCRCPVLAVTANTMMVDVSLVPDVAAGDEVVLLGRQGNEELSASEAAGAAGESVYRLLAGLPAAVPRIWR